MDSQPSHESIPPLLTVPEVAKRLRISERSLWRLLAKKAIVPPLRIGGLLRWRESDIAHWLKNNCPASSQILAEIEMIDQQPIDMIKTGSAERGDA